MIRRNKMKVIVLIIVILSSSSLFSYERIEINYPNHQKYSLDNGKSWIRAYKQITITYPKYQKISYDNGTSWSIVSDDFPYFGVLTHSNSFDVSKIRLVNFKLIDFQSYSFFDKNFILLESGTIKGNQLIFDLKEKGIYYVILNNSQKHFMIRILKHM